MKKVLLLNKISPLGLNLFDKDAYELGDGVENPDGILVRSAKMHDMTPGENLVAVARAGAGVNNIPVDAFSEKGIAVFNTPGANANGVKELTLAALFLAARNVSGGIKWASGLTAEEDVAKTVEKGKSAFGGIELEGKTLGVIGLGAIGGKVANAAASSAIGMNVIGYDPFLSIDSAWNLSRSVKRASGYEEIFKTCDFITLHIPATKDTKGMINKDVLAMMKDGVRIINLSRAELVDTEAMKEALLQGKVARYVTDFPTNDTIGVEGIVTIPHLGASTEESEDNCAIYAAKELIDYLENGNIKNSVNYPNVSMPRSSALRLCVLHRNIPAVLSRISSAVAEEKINIAHMMNASKGEFAYTLTDLDTTAVSKELIDHIMAVEGVIRVRVIE